MDKPTENAILKVQEDLEETKVELCSSFLCPFLKQNVIAAVVDGEAKNAVRAGFDEGYLFTQPLYDFEKQWMVLWQLAKQEDAERKKKIMLAKEKQDTSAAKIIQEEVCSCVNFVLRLRCHFSKQLIRILLKSYWT